MAISRLGMGEAYFELRRSGGGAARVIERMCCDNFINKINNIK